MCSPSIVRIFVEFDDDTISVDYVANPLSWEFLSRRLVDYLWPSIKNDVQLFDAPLIDARTQGHVHDFLIVNVVRVIECLDIAASTIIKTDEGAIAAVTEIALRTSCIPADVHIFRPSEFPYAILFSAELAYSLSGKGLRGMAFSPCISVP